MNKMNIFLLCDSFFERITRIEKIIGMFFLACIVVVIGYQVIARSIFGASLPWAEELATYLFIWISFVGASIAYKQRSHIVIKTFVDKCPLLLNMFINLVVYACIIVACVLMMTSIIYVVIPIEMKSFSVALPIKLPKASFFSFPLLWAISNIFVYTVYLVLKQIDRLIKHKES